MVDADLNGKKFTFSGYFLRMLSNLIIIIIDH